MGYPLIAFRSLRHPGRRKLYEVLGGLHNLLLHQRRSASALHCQIVIERERPSGLEITIGGRIVSQRKKRASVLRCRQPEAD